MFLDRLFGSHTRAAIFRSLFSDTGRKSHLRELARKTGLSAPTVMREAKLLVHDGILVEEKDGNRILYSANRESPFHDALAEIVAKATDGTRLLTEAFSRSSMPLVFIYGSRANGSARADSDYDIFCIGGEGLRKVSSLLSPLRDALGVELNPYVITESEFKERLAHGDHFLREVVSAPKIFVKGDEDGLKAMER